MKRGGGVHTVPGEPGTGWYNKLDGEIVSKHRVKYEAVRAGKQIARVLNVEHTIHRADGVITEKNSYGADSFPPRG
jgi:hypothetical protein